MFVESMKGPLAISTREPEFSWEVPLSGRGRRQSAYRIRLASRAALLEAGEADMWDSGRVTSDQSVHVRYGGARLASNRDYFWTVELWDERGEPVKPMGVSSFGTALLDEGDWKAKWIGLGDANEPRADPPVYQQERVPADVKAIEPEGRSPLMAREFSIGQAVRRARVFVCGLGMYELRLNGRKVGADLLSPPRTDYRKRVLYQTYDVTDALNCGKNLLGLMLGNGWFNGQKSYWGWQMQWYGSPRAIVQMEIELAHGSTQRVISDEQWRGSWSAITFNCLYDGETYDARLEQHGWDVPGFDRSGWRAVNVVPGPGGRLEPMMCEPGRVMERLQPVGFVEPEPGVYVFDMGRNITGWVKLRVRNAQPGSVVKLRYGEAMHADGRLNNASNNRAKQTDQYICRGGTEEQWEPRFTYHGFQFVEVSGLGGTVDAGCIEGQFVRMAVEKIGHFACGSELINRIHRCTVQSLLCNVQMGVPTDDTQRPERLGWGADAWACATAAMYNLSMGRLYSKWLADHRDAQEDDGFIGMIVPQAGAEEDLVWTAAYPLIAWWEYVHGGSRRVLEENYAALQRYMDYLQSVGVNDVQAHSSAKVIKQIKWRCGDGQRLPKPSERGLLQVSQWGDHLSLAEGWMARTNLPLSIATAFYYLDAITMARIARALGREEDGRGYELLAGQINAAFDQRFFDVALLRYDTGTQAAQAWPLAFGMVKEEHLQPLRTKFAADIGSRQRHLTTGYAGTRYAIEALAQADRHDLIWKLANATSYPSWGYMLRLNRTSACERWDGEAGSLNHAALGCAIDEWFYWGLAGIRPDAQVPGLGQIVFKAYFPPDLAWAQASVRTLRGTISSAWRQQDRRIQWRVRVPANCTASVHLPVEASVATEKEPAVAHSPDLAVMETSENQTIVKIGSGKYCFEFGLT